MNQIVTVIESDHPEITITEVLNTVSIASEGPQGIAGVSPKIVATVPTYEDLPSAETSPVDEGYIVQENGNLYFISKIGTWVSVGHIVGPQGEKGEQGDQGVPGVTYLTLSGVVTGETDLSGDIATSFASNPAFTGDATFAGSIDLVQTKLTSNLKSINVITPFLMDAFDGVSYRSAEYTIQISQGVNYIITKLLVIHNGIDVAITEYGTTEIGQNIPYSFQTNQFNGILELLLTCPTANVEAINIKFYRLLYDD